MRRRRLRRRRSAAASSGVAKERNRRETNEGGERRWWGLARVLRWVKNVGLALERAISEKSSGIEKREGLNLEMGFRRRKRLFARVRLW